jgi:RNA polymerase sigma-70 factor (ECF subfamily)
VIAMTARLHDEGMTSATLPVAPIAGIPEGRPTRPHRTATPEETRRLRAIVDENFDFIWRLLRRFGLSEDKADDAAQQVFIVAARKLGDIQSGSERSFLFGTALRVASDVRRSASARREIPHSDVGIELEGGARPDDLVEQRHARSTLDAILEAMDLDLRTVFVLFEIEELSTPEIAELLGIPHGTVASRLRRAREEFTLKVERWKTQRSRGGRP